MNSNEQKMPTNILQSRSMLSTPEALSMISDLVAKIGGRLDIESTSPNGISLSVFLPADPPQTESATRILVVDDNPQMGKFVADVLTAVGYSVVRTTSGDEALRLCSSDAEEIKLLIADVIMPRTSGRQLAKKLAQLNRDTKVLLISGAS